jgi:8-hydroxy-5-deazaflavin:NADPH oxidoreductase
VILGAIVKEIISEPSAMKIGILGAGNIGGTLAKHWAKVGHFVFVGSRHPNDLQKLVREAGPATQAGTLEDAVRFGDSVVLAIPWRKKDDLPSPLLFQGKVVVDAMNPYSTLGRVIDLGDKTSSEEVAKIVPDARLVKAFNTLGANDLKTEAFKTGKDRLAIFVAGDDQEAKRTVSGLIEDIGFVSIDSGSLREGGRLQ